MAKPEVKKSESEDATPELEKPESTNTTPVNLDTIANTLAESMPEVQEHAIEEEKNKNDAIAESYADLKDKAGNGFDPTIHKVNKNGEPTVSPLGNLIKKPGRKKEGSSTKSVIGVKVDPKTDPDHMLKMQSQASGKMAANLLMTIGIVAGGEEWQPMSDPTTGLDEKAMMETAFADYFEATGKTDIPPGMVLTVAIGGYMLPRFTMPKTQSRIQKVKVWFVKKIADRKLKKHGLKTEATLEA